MQSERSGLRRSAGEIALAVLAITLAAQISVPMYPVPMTLQTLAVIVAAALLGTGRAIGATLLYAGLGVAGAPVFADWTAAAGATFLDLKSAGYIAGFVVGAAVTGRWADVRSGRHPLVVFAVALLAHVLVVALGIAWLTRFLSLEAAIAAGGSPFVVGMLVKSAIAAALIHWLRRDSA